MIEARGLAKSFGATRALADVSFEIGAGEVVGLLGPNGSGKTTLLRILTGFFPPDTGAARVAGRSVVDDPMGVRERVGFLPEHAPLYPDMTVDAFLAFAAGVKIEDRRERARRCTRVVEQCGLGRHRSRRVGALSKGYRQRVGLAQALLGEPRVLVLDEPTAGLDPATVLELRDLVRSLRGDVTVVLSSHILADAVSACDRVLVLHEGRLVRVEAVDALRGRIRKKGEVSLRLTGRVEGAASILAGIEGVVDVALESGERETAWVRLATQGRVAEEDERVAAEAARRCVEQGWGILELGPTSRTLEDLFVELLHGEPR